MEELIQAMSIPELENFKKTYEANESVTKIIDGYIEVKTRELAQAKAREDFGKAIGKLVDRLPHPEDIHNIYLAWREVEVEDTSQEAVELAPEVCEANGLEVGTKRHPLHKVPVWVVELNKGFQVAKASSTGSPVTSKRAILVSKRSTDNPNHLEEVGKFASASKACEYLKLILGGDSATRVLLRDGYFLEPYQGTDYTS